MQKRSFKEIQQFAQIIEPERVGPKNPSLGCPAPERSSPALLLIACRPPLFINDSRVDLIISPTSGRGPDKRGLEPRRRHLGTDKSQLKRELVNWKKSLKNHLTMLYRKIKNSSLCCSSHPGLPESRRLIF
ncbi:hypothetical protein mRhiFer1_010068 [Rhinolophus ferrumequinum]|uniref:Uncharacterized protein n=1 Tax=Rhinolophus ferrumequinum TaxID=59479 RepID=A0A7J7Y5A3_RHIFE|nr:hypothetical protein mRhiFer1_010068 [Rhinolophus ferrumequinum]